MDILFRNKRTGKIYAGEVKSCSAKRNPEQRAKDALIDAGKGTFGKGGKVPIDLRGISTEGVSTIVIPVGP